MTDHIPALSPKLGFWATLSLSSQTKASLGFGFLSVLPASACLLQQQQVLASLANVVFAPPAIMLTARAVSYLSSPPIIRRAEERLPNLWGALAGTVVPTIGAIATAAILSLTVGFYEKAHYERANPVHSSGSSQTLNH